jgi:hypothetical protein
MTMGLGAVSARLQMISFLGIVVYCRRPLTESDKVDEQTLPWHRAFCEIEHMDKRCKEVQSQDEECEDAQSSLGM